MANELVFIVDQNDALCKKVTGWLQEIGFQTKTFEATENLFLEATRSLFCRERHFDPL
jgi:FixJ family two-component response regulator